MMPDEVMQELWQSKDRIAREHGYEMDALVAHLQGKERHQPTLAPRAAKR